jgi:hypothetical protein
MIADRCNDVHTDPTKLITQSATGPDSSSAVTDDISGKRKVTQGGRLSCPFRTMLAVSGLGEQDEE